MAKPCRPCNGKKSTPATQEMMMVGETSEKPLGQVFERVYVLNLERRPDRLKQFEDNLPADWPFMKPARFNACDGKLCKHPVWWRQGGGAWGCYRSHLLILEKCLNDGVQSYLVLEDDAVIPPDFAARWQEFYENVPADWGMLYLGGQHLMQKKSPPVIVAPGVLQPFNVNRTHAFGLRGETMTVVYRHLMATKDWRPGHHVDHMLGRFHMQRSRPVYCPSAWLIGQADGKSNVSGRDVPERFWNGAIKAVPAEASPKVRHQISRVSRPATDFVAVIGLHRSGSSCLAMCLSKLGVHLGNKFVGCEPDGGGEARDLRNLCEGAMPFPSTTVRHLDQAAYKLARFVKARCQEAASKKTIAGGKYPHLCVLASTLPAICGERLKVIHIDRPVEQSIASLIRREPKRDAAQLEATQRFLLEKKELFLAGREHLTITYDALLANPRRELERAREYLALPLDEARMDAAVAYVDAGRRHILGNS